MSLIPGHLVEEIHLAGHTIDTTDGGQIRIDDHGSPVSDAVWQLYGDTVATIGRRPTLIEWDNNVPDLEVLLGEAEHAREVAVAASEHESFRSRQHARTP